MKKLLWGFLLQISPLKVFFVFSVFYRCYEIFKRSTISLGVVAALLLVCCMMACFYCLKKRGEVYILRNTQGIDNHHAHLKTQMKVLLKVKRKEGSMRERSKDEYVTNCKNGMLNRGLIMKELLKTKGFLKIFYFETETLKVLTFPLFILMFMLRFLIIFMLKMKCYKLMCSW